MKVLFAATPVAGHLNPILAIARMVLSRGDEALVATATYLKPAVEKAGARFFPLATGADIDLSRIEEFLPKRASLSPGPELLLYEFKRVFFDTMSPQAATLRKAIREERPDIIVVDDFFWGATALFLDDATPRPPIVACATSVLMAERLDGAPALLGLAPAKDPATQARYATIAAKVEASFSGPARGYVDGKLADMGLPPLPCSILHSRHVMADAYLMTTVRAFEYDFGPLPTHVKFVGALPPPPARDKTRPMWWHEVDSGKAVVLVTQGTIGNSDFGEVIEPALAALADRDDLLVLVTTGGRPIENVQGRVPNNAHLTAFLDYGALFPKLSAVVTNGGYGTVSLALRAGVPIVAAGRMEDKADVGARVAWSGVGIEIQSQRPSIEDLRAAVGLINSLRGMTPAPRKPPLASRFGATNTLILRTWTGSWRCSLLHDQRRRVCFSDFPIMDAQPRRDGLRAPR